MKSFHKIFTQFPASAAFLLLSVSSLAQAAVPQITTIPDQSTSQGQTYTYTPSLANAGTAGTVNWTKAYGPDDAKVDPATGKVTWAIPSTLPSESFYIGLRASNADGHTIENWIVNVGVNTVVYVGPNDTDKTLGAAFAKHTAPGTTFILRDGTYSGDNFSIARLASGVTQYPPQGTASAFTNVLAEDPGQVTLTGGAVVDINGINGPVGYMTIKGLFVKGTSITTTGYIGTACTIAAGCRPHHIKFMYDGVESDGNIPFNAFRSDDILLENNYAFGGGRYKFASYQSNRVVFRRNVARYDRSNNEMAEPKGTYSIYTTMDAVVSNNIAVDGDQPQFVTLGQLAGAYTCPTTSGPTRVVFDRNIQLNSTMLYGNIDHQQGACDAEIKNLVSWDVRPIGVYVMTRAGSWFDHVTMGDIVPTGGYQAQLFNGWPSDLARGITNSVLYNIQNGDLFYGLTKQSGVTLIDRTVDRYGVANDNITKTPGKMNVADSTIDTASLTSYDPIYSSANLNGGLRYIIRIEPNSNLTGKGGDGGDLGANVVTFKGKSGTLWGQPGYNSETNIPMWPFPLEDVIKAKMAAYTYTGNTYSGDEYNRVVSGTGTINGARGFAVSGQTLTNYIWNYIGNTVPPFDVTAVAGSGQATVKWDPPASMDLSTLSGYKVYDFDPSTKTLSNPRSVAKTATSLIIGSLTKGSTYHFAVTAVDSKSGESSFGYPVDVTITSGAADKAPPNPPTVDTIQQQ